jgi:hypothetical protein
MTPLWWMIGGAVASCAVAAMAAPGEFHPELVFGMLGPLASAAVTWVVARRTHQATPERMTGVMIAGFMARMVFFGVYVIVMVRVLNLSPIPFVISFAGYFIALYATEALFLKRLLAGAYVAPRA